MSAYRHWEDRKQWLRIILADGMEWDEPISGWSEIWNFTTGVMSYRHTDGREITAA